MASLDQMRDFMQVCEAYGLTAPVSGSEAEVIVEAASAPMVPSPALLSDLRDVLFKLRAFTETAVDGDFALGVEDGMQRAADMIERVIRTHWSEDGSRT